MRILLPIMATLMLALPALGSEVLLFPDKRLDNPDICDTNLDNVPAKDKAFHFVPIETCRVAQHYSWNASGYFHNPHPAPAGPDLTQPRPVQFIKDCTADGSIPANMRQNLNIMTLWFRHGDKDVALLIWELIKASATVPQRNAIQTHATNNNITLP